MKILEEGYVIMLYFLISCIFIPVYSSYQKIESDFEIRNLIL